MDPSYSGVPDECDAPPFEDEFSFADIFAIGRADFLSGYTNAWTPHLGSLAQDEIMWSIWLSGWESAREDSYDRHRYYVMAWREKALAADEA